MSRTVKTHHPRWLGRCGCGAPANVRIQTILKPRGNDSASPELKSVGYLLCEACATRFP